MQIGEPKREIYVEPLELPEPLREHKPSEMPVEEPENVPVREKKG